MEIIETPDSSRIFFQQGRGLLKKGLGSATWDKFPNNHIFWESASLTKLVSLSFGTQIGYLVFTVSFSPSTMQSLIFGPRFEEFDKKSKVLISVKSVDEINSTEEDMYFFTTHLYH